MIEATAVTSDYAIYRVMLDSLLIDEARTAFLVVDSTAATTRYHAAGYTARIVRRA